MSPVVMYGFGVKSLNEGQIRHSHPKEDRMKHSMLVMRKRFLLGAKSRHEVAIPSPSEKQVQNRMLNESGRRGIRAKTAAAIRNAYIIGFEM